MSTVKNLRNFSQDLPEVVADARKSLAQLGAGVNKANATMGILALVSVVALGVAIVALSRAGARHA